MAIKLAVRKRCGFGCVICGNPIVEYDHFDPEYKDAESHDPAGITLLCGGCHGKKTKGLLSRETVASANMQPAALKGGVLSEMIDIGSRPPVILFGTNKFINPRSIVRVADEEIITVRSNPGGPFLINLTMRDESGREVLGIRDNELLVKADEINDVEFIGNRIIISSSSEDQRTELAIIAGVGIEIVEMSTFIHGVSIKCKKGKFTVGVLEHGFDFSGCVINRGSLVHVSMDVINEQLGNKVDRMEKVIPFPKDKMEGQQHA